MDIKGKKILLIGIGFYDYENIIKQNLEYKEACVNYYNSVYLPIFFRIIRKLHLFKNYISYYRLWRFKNYIKKTKKHFIFDYVFVLKGEFLTPSHFLYLKENSKGAKYILYLWDSIVRIHGIMDIIPFFDKVLTFDHLDAQKYNFILRPLFFREQSSQLSYYKYDVSFVGRMHSNRKRLIEEIQAKLINQGFNVYFILAVPKYQWIILKYIKRTINNDSHLYITKKINYADYIDICNSSKTILDISHPRQSGLTMRTIEAIGFNRKLLTTNENIKFYDIPSNFYYIIDVNNPVIDKDFINDITDFKDIPNKFYYSLSYFIDDIFSD
jgi:hypothetical protein